VLRIRSFFSISFCLSFARRSYENLHAKEVKLSPENVEENAIFFYKMPYFQTPIKIPLFFALVLLLLDREGSR
jgi:hypothetical protein